MSKTEAKKQTKGDPKPSPFVESITGTIKTLNLLKDNNDQVIGVRGRIVLSADSIQAIESKGFKVNGDTAIYKLTYEKISSWVGSEAVQINDEVTFGSVFINNYKGKVQDWKDHLYLSLCADGFVEVVEGERLTNGKFKSKKFMRPTNQQSTPGTTSKPPASTSSVPKVVGTDEQLFNALVGNIEQAEEALKRLKSISTVGKILNIDYRNFHKLSTDVTLSLNRMFSTILHILERE